MGIIWVFDYNGNNVECPNPNASPIFTLCLAMLLIYLVQLCLPCVVTLVLLPCECDYS